MEASYQTAALTASGLSWAAVQQLSAISGGLETRRPKIDLRSRAVDKPKQGVEFSIFHFRRDRVVVPIARKHLLPDPLFFRCIFSGRSRRSERHVAKTASPASRHDGACVHPQSRIDLARAAADVR